MTSPLIVFTTDFGLSDSYAGVMKGVALGINPGLRFIDLTHQVAPQKRDAGRFRPRRKLPLLSSRCHPCCRG